ncbi:tafazzin-PC [Coprinopsis marcescibilis]|uniref:Tafazzin family protein n=1 Tax=Coprinopsis marcescibilis TaxID=230819 RepID=A0A5C3L883_COPMA|nr:tafazzin-PC [Coprinopsis marcescibilis]
MTAAVLSKLTVAGVGLICKSFFNLGFCSVQVNRLDILLDALDNSDRNNGKGVVTVSNHISTLDDPLTWGILPSRCYFSSRTTRWALGASEVMFTNPIFSTFFRLGQTLETFRGQGIYQESVNTAISKLDQGAWVHLFGEGKVNQPSAYPVDCEGLAHLPRFKWGIGRIVSESIHQPVVIPMWLAGYENLMPEGRTFPYKYLPRPGACLSVTFGDPIPATELSAAIEAQAPSPIVASPLKVPLGDAQRSKLTALIHSHVERLGRGAYGKTLSLPP